MPQIGFFRLSEGCVVMEFFAKDEVNVGKDLGVREFDITPAMVDVYAAGTGDNSDLSRERSALGFTPAPALILHSEAFKAREWYLPNLVGNLHARFECDILAPIPVGGRIETRCFVANRYIKRDRDYVVNQVMAFDPNGRLVFSSRSHQSFLIPQENQTVSGFAVDKSRERAPGRSFKAGERGGDPIELPMRRITDDMCMAFSGPKRNYHTDREEARKLGFPDLVVQGMLSVCLIGEMMTRRFGLGFFYGGRLAVNLVNVLWGNESTSARGLIFDRRPEGARTRAELEVWCEKADGTKTVIGTASALDLDAPARC